MTNTNSSAKLYNIAKTLERLYGKIEDIKHEVSDGSITARQTKDALDMFKYSLDKAFAPLKRMLVKEGIADKDSKIRTVRPVKKTKNR